MAFWDTIKKIGSGALNVATKLGSSGLFGALGNVASGVIGALSQKNTNVSNQQLQKDQNQWNEEMWMQQQEYNNPSNQMQRLKDAGLNPISTEMAQGGVDAGNASAPPQQAPLIPNVDPVQSAGNFASALGSSASLMQNALTTASTRKLTIAQMQQQVEHFKLSCEQIGLDNEHQRIINQYADAQQRLSLDKGKIDLKWSEQQLHTAAVEFKKSVFQLEKTMPAELKEIMSRTDVNTLSLDEIAARTEDYLASAALKEEQEKTEQAHQNLLANQAETEEYKQGNLSADTSLKHEQKRNEHERFTEVHYSGEQARESFQMFVDTYDDVVTQFSIKTGCDKMQAFQIFFHVLQDYPKMGLNGIGSVGSIMSTIGKVLK